MNHFFIGSCFCQYVYWTFTMMALESVCQFWVLMTKVLLLLPVSELVLLLQWYNVTQQWHQIFSFSLIIVDWTRLPLSFATRAGRWDYDRLYSQFYKVYLEGCLNMMTWLKIHKSHKWIAMFRTKRTNTLQCRCFSTAISQHVLVYMAPNSKIFRTEVRIESPISSQFTTSQHWAHSSRQNPSTKPSQILDCVHTGSGVRTHIAGWLMSADHSPLCASWAASNNIFPAALKIIHLYKQNNCKSIYITFDPLDLSNLLRNVNHTFLGIFRQF